MLILVLIIIILLLMRRRETFIGTGNIRSMKYHDPRRSWDKGIVGKVLRDHGYKLTEGDDWNISHPASRSYDKIKLSRLNEDTCISVVPNTLILESKYQLWDTLKSYYGRNRASKIMPEVFELPDDIKIFNKKYRKGDYFVLKKDVGRQRGILLTDDKNKIMNHKDDNYHSAQRYIHDSITYKDRKLNFRIYLLVVCARGMKRAYMYKKDGIMVYTGKRVSDGLSQDTGITQVDHPNLLKLYDNGHPHLMADYFKEEKNGDIIMSGAKKRFVQLMKACGDNICGDGSVPSYRLYGADFLYTSNYYPYLIEVNGRPGLNPRGEMDKEMRYELIRQTFALLGFISGDHSGYVEIWRN